jgi:hypothetical protein
MLFAQVNDERPGHIFSQHDSRPTDYRVSGEVHSSGRLERIEVVVNGRILKTLPASNEAWDASCVSTFDEHLSLAETSWICVRAVQRLDNGRVRFAHSAPWHIQVEGAPIRPRRAEVDYLIRRVQDEIDRNADVLPEAAMAEYRQALQIYRNIAQRAQE